jgi:hypothetical protein
MTTSGTKTFELDVSEIIEEAFERCGMEARTGYDMRTARRSLNLLLAEWSNRGLNRWTIQQSDLAIYSGDEGSYDLESYTLDILSMVVRNSDDTDIVMERISRENYLNIPDKSQTGRPVQYYVDRQTTPVLKIWPIPDETYTLVYDHLVRMDDVTHSTQTVDVPSRFAPCLVAGLAYYISLKRAPERSVVLKQLYEEEFSRAALEDRDRASFFIRPARGYRL